MQRSGGQPLVSLYSVLNPALAGSDSQRSHSQRSSDTSQYPDSQHSSQLSAPLEAMSRHEPRQRPMSSFGSAWQESASAYAPAAPNNALPFDALLEQRAMVSREHFDAMMREQEQTQSAGIAELQRQHGNLAAMVKDLTGNVHMLYESFERVGDAVGKLQEHVQEQGALLQQRLPLTPPRPDRQRRQPPAAAHQLQQQPPQPPQPQPRPTFASPLLARVLAVSPHLDIFDSPSSDWSDQEGEEGSDEDDAQMVGGAGQQHRNGRLAKRKRRNAQI